MLAYPTILWFTDPARDSNSFSRLEEGTSYLQTCLYMLIEHSLPPTSPQPLNARDQRSKGKIFPKGYASPTTQVIINLSKMPAIHT